MTLLERLKKLVPPPASPKGVGSPAQWERTERTFAISLPPDYREFVHTYGNFFGDFYIIHTPAKGEYTNIVTYLHRLQGFWRDDAPYRPYPAPSGLLPWAHDE